MSYIDDYVRNIAQMGGNGNLESLEELESIDKVLRSRGIPESRRRIQANQIMKDPLAKKMFMQEAKRAPVEVKRLSGERIAGQFDIVISRPTILITEDLPVAIFGASAVNSSYRKIVNQYLPAGVTFTVAVTSTGDVTFTFVSGANTDIITISCPQTPYSELLANMIIDQFTLNQVKYFLTDVTANGQKQLNKTFDYKSVSLFGKNTGDSIPLKAAKSVFQFQNDGVEVPGEYQLDKYFNLIVSMQKEVAQTVSLNMFVQSIDRF